MPLRSAYYNEIDPYAAQWLRNLIAAGHIAPGVVDERDICDIQPADLVDFTQCHFFAGIGVWSAALRAAGWPDDRPVWTGSCPCQPFSAAGKGGGFADERHLWPSWHWLIANLSPPTIFGEQVASKDGLAWLDLVSTDMEGLGYACGAVPFPAAGVGAPHQRHRTYFVADATGARHDGALARTERDSRHEARLRVPSEIGGPGCMADTDQGQRGRLAARERERDRQAGGRVEGDGCPAASCATGELGDAVVGTCERDAGSVSGAQEEVSREDRPQHGDRTFRPEYAGASVASRPGPVNGFWRASDWLYCRDDKWRPVEPSTFPLAHGAPARVGRLRAYGNAICLPQAQAFIEAYMSL